MIGKYTGPASGPRVYHHTAPVSMIRSLHAGLGAILDEARTPAMARHAECGRLLHEGLTDLGLELFAAEGHRLPELTTVLVPDGVDDAKVRSTLLERYGIEIGGGGGGEVGKKWGGGGVGRTPPAPHRPPGVGGGGGGAHPH